MCVCVSVSACICVWGEGVPARLGIHSSESSAAEFSDGLFPILTARIAAIESELAGVRARAAVADAREREGDGLFVAADVAGLRLATAAAVRVVTGPVVGRVTAGTAVVLLELNTTAWVTAYAVPRTAASVPPPGDGSARVVVRDVLKTRAGFEAPAGTCACTVRLRAWRPGSVLFHSLEPGFTYEIVLEGVSAGDIANARATFTIPVACMWQTRFVRGVDVAVPAGVHPSVVTFHIGGQVDLAPVAAQALAMAHGFESLRAMERRVYLGDMRSRVDALIRGAYRAQWGAADVRPLLATGSHLMLGSEVDMPHLSYPEGADPFVEDASWKQARDNVLVAVRKAHSEYQAALWGRVGDTPPPASAEAEFTVHDWHTTDAVRFCVDDIAVAGFSAAHLDSAVVKEEHDVVIREFDTWLQGATAARPSIRVLLVVTPSSLFRAKPELRFASRLVHSIMEWLEQDFARRCQLVCGSGSLAAGCQAELRSYRHDLELLVVGPRFLPLPVLGAAVSGEPGTSVDAAVITSSKELRPVSGSMIVAVSLPGESAPAPLRVLVHDEVIPPSDFNALVTRLASGRHEGHFSVDSLGELRLASGLAVVPRPLARIVVGPVIGRVTSSTAIFLLEFDVACRVQCTLVDVISGQQYTESCAFEANVANTMSWTGLSEGRRYAMHFDGTSNGDARRGYITTTALDPSCVRIASVVHTPGQHMSFEAVASLCGRPVAVSLDDEDLVWRQLWSRVQRPHCGGIDVLVHVGAQVEIRDIIAKAVAMIDLGGREVTEVEYEREQFEAAVVGHIFERDAVDSNAYITGESGLWMHTGARCTCTSHADDSGPYAKRVDWTEPEAWYLPMNEPNVRSSTGGVGHLVFEMSGSVRDASEVVHGSTQHTTGQLPDNWSSRCAVHEVCLPSEVRLSEMSGTDCGGSVKYPTAAAASESAVLMSWRSRLRPVILEMFRELYRRKLNLPFLREVLCNVPNIFTGGPAEMYPDLFAGVGPHVDYPADIVALAMQAWFEYVGQLVDVDAVKAYDTCRIAAIDAVARGSVAETLPNLDDRAYFQALRGPAATSVAVREVELASPSSTSLERWQLHRWGRAGLICVDEFRNALSADGRVTHRAPRVSAAQLSAVEKWLKDPTLATVVVVTSCTLAETESTFGVGGVMWLLVAWLGAMSGRTCHVTGTSASHSSSHSLLLRCPNVDSGLRFGCTLLAPATGGYSRDAHDDRTLPSEVRIRRPAVDNELRAAVAVIERRGTRCFGLTRHLIGDSWTRCEGYMMGGPLPAVALVGPVVGRVTDSAACILLEVDADCDVACIVVDALMGTTSRQTRRLRGETPTVFCFRDLAERTQYAVKFEGIADALDRTGAFTTLATCPARMTFAFLHSNEPLLRTSGAVSAPDGVPTLAPYETVECGVRGCATELTISGLSSPPSSDKWRELWYSVRPPHAPYSAIVHVGRQVDAAKHFESGVIDDLMTRELEWGAHTFPDVESVRASYWSLLAGSGRSGSGSAVPDADASDGFLRNPFLIDVMDNGRGVTGARATVSFADTPSVVMEVLSRVQEAYRHSWNMPCTRRVLACGSNIMMPSTTDIAALGLYAKSKDDRLTCRIVSSVARLCVSEYQEQLHAPLCGDAFRAAAKPGPARDDVGSAPSAILTSQSEEPAVAVHYFDRTMLLAISAYAGTRISATSLSERQKLLRKRYSEKPFERVSARQLVEISNCLKAPEVCVLIIATTVPLLGGRKPEEAALRLTRMLLRWQAQKTGRTVQFVAGSASQVAKYGFETSTVLGPALSACQLVLGTIASPLLQNIRSRRGNVTGNVRSRRPSAVALAIAAAGDQDADAGGAGAIEEPDVRVGDVRYIGMKDEEAVDSYPDASDEVINVTEGTHIGEVCLLVCCAR